MRTGKDRVQVEELDGPVTIGGIRITPGAAMIGDADGVIAIPADYEEQVFEVATEIGAREEAIRKAVRGGATLLAARTEFGYHNLQTRQGTAP
jgi:4-hydroxy-4-methyl-2-oxoglutarate aldolase